MHDRPAIYVASRASVPARGAMWRDLRQRGVLITSTWIDKNGEGATLDQSEQWARIASEVTSSDHLILYVEENDFPLKGAFVEIGMALGANIPVSVVAPCLGRPTRRDCRPFGS